MANKHCEKMQYHLSLGKCQCKMRHCISTANTHRAGSVLH
jgi:hypothetical protein